ncbi:MAG: helix-turn-helix domain-containing protein [Acetatifactor sp.]|nr:helix-turn-helix domain-containing protein [Acetatifactor sp.]
MNMNIISKYLQFLRKSHNYTQDDMAKKLDVSRQAVSKWETGTAIPDPEVLLEISKLYDITINDILEPRVQPQRITDFEQISAISEKEVKEALKQFDADSLVTALMGASPETNSFCERMFPDVDFDVVRNNIGRIRIETVEDMQNQIVAMINLQAVVPDTKGCRENC